MQQYDLILYGATSFVGKIIAAYLLQQQQALAGSEQAFTWAMAGRSATKLDSLKADLGEAANDINIVLADASDADALKAMCESTKVILTTVGPYALYGDALVKACANSGTGYCDLTGETQFVHRMLNRYEDAAKQSGAKIVHCCGFDSIPSDMGVYFLQQAALERFGKACTAIDMQVKRIKGGASGGTLASGINIVKEATKDKSLRKVLTNPYALCPKDHPFKSRQYNQHSARLDKVTQSWTAPFVMAAINTRIVHRTNALLDCQYSKDFLYQESVMTGKGKAGKRRASIMSLGIKAFFTGAAIPPARWFMEKYLLTKPGDGPSEKEQQEGMYQMLFTGTTDDGQVIQCEVEGDRDPGYGSTAKMIGQAALCLAKDVEDKAAGFWTPASLFGDKLITRLQQDAGISFTLY